MIKLSDNNHLRKDKSYSRQSLKITSRRDYFYFVVHCIASRLLKGKDTKKS